MSVVVEWIKDAGKLEALRPAWHRLAQRALEPNPFYEAELLLPAFRHLDTERASVAVLLVWRESAGERQLVGLLPVQRSRKTRRLPIRSIGPWQHEFAVLATPLLDREVAPESLSAMLAALKVEAPLLRLHRLAGEGPVAELFAKALAGNRRLVDESYSRPLLVKGLDPDEYLRKTTSSRRRSHLARQLRQLGEVGEVKFEELQSMEQVERATQQFLEMEASGWKGREGTAMASCSGQAEFFAEVLQGFAEQDRLLILSLSIDAEPIAMRTSLLAGDGAFTFKVAYNEEYSAMSPGVLLEIENVRRSLPSESMAWMDSCAVLKSSPMYWLWSDGRAIESSLVACNFVGGSVLKMLPMLASLRDRFRSNKGESK